MGSERIRNTTWSPATYKAFNFALQRLFRNRLNGVRVAGLPESYQRAAPVVLAANHISWWDGFFLLELYRLSGARSPFYTLMLESQLRKHPYFRRLGAVGITPGDASSLRRAINFITTSRSVHGSLWLSFFPQGRIWPSTKRPLGFESGVASFANRLAPATLWPVGLHIEPLNEMKPTAFVNVGMPIVVDGRLESQEVETAVTDSVDAVLAHVQRHGEDADRAWPARPVDTLDEISEKQAWVRN